MADPQGANAVLFRAFSMPGRKPRGEWLAASIEIGTRSTCALLLNDPVVAEHHCTFRAVGNGFVVEDLGSATGTWHNGVAVVAPVALQSGDQVVIGVTRLTVELKEDQGRPVFEIVVEEASFHYKRTKAGEFHTDADEWVRSEVRFGRIPAVRSMAWLAGFVALIGLVFVFTTKSGEKLLQPGQLDGTHAALFAADPAKLVSTEESGKKSFQDARELVLHQSCRVCHTSSQPGDVSSCATCHAEMGTRHPFYTGVKATDSRLAAGVLQPSDGCRMCHEVQHSGLSATASTDAARELIRKGTQDHSPGVDVCLNCHTTGLGAKEDVMTRVRSLAAMLVDAKTRTSTDRHEYGFDEFSHERHCNKDKQSIFKQAIDCAVCHVQAPAAAGAAHSADFSSVRFEVCAACHVTKGMPVPAELPGIDAAALSALRKQLADNRMAVSMTWHGRGDQCFECHARVGKDEEFKKALQTVERTIATKTYGIVRMGHQQHVTAAGSKSDCRVCHGDLKTLAGGAAPVAEFLHGSHVETLWPATAADRNRLSAESCSACHAAQWESTSLADAAKFELGSACKSCHADPSRPETEKLVTEKVGERKTVSAAKFSHALHQGKVEGACFACHAFKGADDGDPRSKPFVAEEVANCTKCHNDHQNIEKGACTFCHPAGAGAGSGSAVLFEGKKPSRLDWPAGFVFEHFKGTEDHGHRSYMNKAGRTSAEGCSRCHDLGNLKSASAVLAVAIPGARGDLCIDCHATERGWFHWMLPDPTSPGH